MHRLARNIKNRRREGLGVLARHHHQAAASSSAWRVSLANNHARQACTCQQRRREIIVRLFDRRNRGNGGRRDIVMIPATRENGARYVIKL